MSENDADREPRISISKGSTLILDGDALTSDLRMLEFPNICLLIWSLKEGHKQLYEHVICKKTH